MGAYIELRVAPVPPGAWSVVQWQDWAGGWHDVEGWQGEVGPDGFERWWVAAKDFNTGPFRWQVTQGRGGAELGLSRPFILPAGGNQVVRVDVTPDLAGSGPNSKNRHVQPGGQALRLSRPTLPGDLG